MTGGKKKDKVRVAFDPFLTVFDCILHLYCLGMFLLLRALDGFCVWSERSPKVRLDLFQIFLGSRFSLNLKTLSTSYPLFASF